MYEITDYTKKQARILGVTVRPSTNPKKKIDVYKGDNKICSVGATGYGDYPTYVLKNGQTYAETKRRLYKLRHNKDRLVENSNGFYADKLLW